MRGYLKGDAPWGQFWIALKFRDPDVSHNVGEIINTPTLQDSLGNLCESLTQLVQSGLDWLSLVDKDSSGRSFIPSISSHAQDRHLDDFGTLIALLRTAFDKRCEDDPGSADNIAMQWRDRDFPLFKRLFLYAANKRGSSQDSSACSLLMEDNAKWIWAPDTEREVSVYLRERVKHWDASDVSLLCDAILRGPDRTQYRAMSDDEWQERKDQMIVKLLAKLEQGEVTLPEHAVNCLSRLRESPDYYPSDDHSDEFGLLSAKVEMVRWDDEIDLNAYASFEQQNASDLIANWSPNQSPMLRKMGTDDTSATLEVLERGIAEDMADESFWSAGIEGLNKGIETLERDDNKAILRVDCIHRVLSIFNKFPERAFRSPQVAEAIAELWRRHIDHSIDKTLYLEAWDRIWPATHSDASSEEGVHDPVHYAINDPAGRLTEALLKDFWPKDAKIGGGLPKDLTDRIKRIMDKTSSESINASSLIVASRTEVLHRIDPEFTKQHVLPLLKWNGNPNAADYWSAFLWPARINPDLFKLMKDDCVSALKAPEKFEDKNGYEKLCQVFLLSSMEFQATSKETVREVLDAVGVGGLEHMSSFIRQRMPNSQEDAAQYWEGILMPWLDAHWLRDDAKQSDITRRDFAMIAVYSDSSFPAALECMKSNGLLGETKHASYILHTLRLKFGSTLTERFPKDVLRLLCIIRPSQWDSDNLKQILDRAVKAQPDLVDSLEYKELKEGFSSDEQLPQYSNQVRGDNSFKNRLHS